LSRPFALLRAVLYHVPWHHKPIHIRTKPTNLHPLTRTPPLADIRALDTFGIPHRSHSSPISPPPPQRWITNIRSSTANSRASLLTSNAPTRVRPPLPSTTSTTSIRSTSRRPFDLVCPAGRAVDRWSFPGIAQLSAPSTPSLGLTT